MATGRGESWRARILRTNGSEGTWFFIRTLESIASGKKGGQGWKQFPFPKSFKYPGSPRIRPWRPVVTFRYDQAVDLLALSVKTARASPHCGMAREAQAVMEAAQTSARQGRLAEVPSIY